jgi:hypothetical protein
MRRTRSSIPLLWILLVALVGAPGTASAASILYGNFGPVPPGVSFEDVEESSGTDTVPLYGPPELFAVGLDFDPTSLVAMATGGAQDVTDGQLNFTIDSDPLVAITGISVFEAGDYSLSGAGTMATGVSAGVTLRASVTQINGVDVAPISLAPVNGSVSFNLASNAAVLSPWSLGVSLNVAGQLPEGQHATQVEVVIDNLLLALSETSSTAFIAKKDFKVTTETTVIPEPSTLALLLGAVGAIAATRRRTWL